MFNINVDYKLSAELTKDISYPELTIDYISFAVSNVYEKGLDGQKRRIWARIQRKFDAALESKNYEIQFEQAEIDFIKQSFREATFPAKISMAVTTLEDALENLGK